MHVVSLELGVVIARRIVCILSMLIERGTEVFASADEFTSITGFVFFPLRVCSQMKRTWYSSVASVSHDSQAFTINDYLESDLVSFVVCSSFTPFTLQAKRSLVKRTKREAKFKLHVAEVLQLLGVCASSANESIRMLVRWGLFLRFVLEGFLKIDEMLFMGQDVLQTLSKFVKHDGHAETIRYFRVLSTLACTS